MRHIVGRILRSRKLEVNNFLILTFLLVLKYFSRQTLFSIMLVVERVVLLTRRYKSRRLRIKNNHPIWEGGNYTVVAIVRVPIVSILPELIEIQPCVCSLMFPRTYD